jgi:hypothetical protein
MDKVLPVMAGRSTERPASFPDALFYRGRAGDGADCLATFDRRTVLLSRSVGGLACRIRVGVGQYRAVALVSSDDHHVVCLMHSQPGLSVDLMETESLEAAEALRDQLSDFLDLPQIEMGGLGATDEDRAARREPAARRQLPLKARRPRFLARRRSGEPVEIRRIDGREIIARS